MSGIADWLRGFVYDAAFLKAYPYYAAVLARMEVIEDPSVPVMAVSTHQGHFYLHVNVGFFMTAPQYLRGVLLHEVHHVVLGHITHPRFQGVAHPALMTVAMEVSANEYITEPLPGSPLRWNQFPMLTAGQSTMERYERLAAARATLKLPEPLPVLEGTLQLGEDAPGQVEALIVQAEVEVKVQGNVAESRLCGHTPGELLTALHNLDAPPEVFVDWRAALQRFVGLRRAPRPSFAWPSRRFPAAVGQIPGRRYRHTLGDRPHVLIAIDTSGSMPQAELEEIARQLRVMQDHARLTIAECDVKIHRVYAFTGRLPTVMGRGGTDLRPVFAPDFLGPLRVDGVVYFTDGDGPFHKIDPGVLTLWVLTRARPFACPWGEQVRMSPGT